MGRARWLDVETAPHPAANEAMPESDKPPPPAATTVCHGIPVNPRRPPAWLMPRAFGFRRGARFGHRRERVADAGFGPCFPLLR